MGFLNIPTSAGGFANDVVALLANRRKIDQERELERRRKEEEDRLVKVAEGVNADVENDRVEGLLSQLPGMSREDVQAFASKHRDAEAWNGRLYRDRAEMDADNKARIKSRLEREEGQRRGKTADDAYAEAEKKAKQVRAVQAAALGSLNEDNSTPEARERIKVFHDGLVAKAQADLEKAYRDTTRFKNGQVVGATAEERELNKASLNVVLDALNKAVADRDLANMDASSFGTSAKEYHRGISEAVQPFLEAAYITEALPRRIDPRVQEASRARAIERRYPDIVRARRVIPEQTKMLEDWLKSNEKQGDKSSDLDAKASEAELNRAFAAINSARNATAASAKTAADQALKALDLLRKGKRDNAMKVMQQAEIDQKYWIANQKNLTDIQSKMIGTQGAIVGSALQNQLFYTDKGQEAVKGYLDTYKAAYNAYNKLLQEGRLLKKSNLVRGEIPGLPDMESIENRGIPLEGFEKYLPWAKEEKVPTPVRFETPDPYTGDAALGSLRERGNGKPGAAKATKKKRRAATPDDFGPPK